MKLQVQRPSVCVFASQHFSLINKENEKEETRLLIKLGKIVAAILGNVLTHQK